MYNKIIILVVLASTFLTGCDSSNVGGMNTASKLTEEQAKVELQELLDNVAWTQNLNPRRANIELTKANLMTTLPDINEFPLVVSPFKSEKSVIAEIYVSSEKSGNGSDGWMKEAAANFNQSKQKLSTGELAQIAIRKIASGTAYQFIASGKATPDAYSPSNHLWVEMVKGHGIEANPLMEKTVGNVAGIVLKKDITKQLKQSHSEVSVPVIIDAVIQGQLVMGYTNPFASSTGLNFLVSVLNSFSNSTDNTMLSNDVVSSFEAFQKGVPYVAMTTLQMRDSVANNGVLDAFVMEYQTFASAKPSMMSEYDFIPFGIRHDNPLYSIGTISDEKESTLKLFSKYLQTASMQKKIKNYGFDGMPSYQSSFDIPAGSVLIKAQKVWKEKKSAGKKTIAIFLADVSGSMAGERIKALKTALKKGSDFISKENHIGLVSFASKVNVEVPPKPFNLIHKSSFYAATEDLTASGSAAVYNGVVVSLSLLLEAKKANPDSNLMLFVLSDGERSEGYHLSDIKEVVRGIGIPVYTIAYANEVAELKELSSLVEATMKKANEGNAEYAIGSLLNAQM